MTFLSIFLKSSFQNYFTNFYVLCLILFIYVIRRIHVFKFYVSSITFFCIVLHHLSVTNGSVGKHRNVDHFSVKISQGQSSLYQDVDHFSVKILKIQHAESLTNVALSEIRNVDHLSVKISMPAQSNKMLITSAVRILVGQNYLVPDQDVDHFSMKILKLRHYTEPLTSPVFIFNVTKAVVLNTFFTAKGRISML